MANQRGSKGVQSLSSVKIEKGVDSVIGDKRVKFSCRRLDGRERKERESQQGRKRGTVPAFCRPFPYLVTAVVAGREVAPTASSKIGGGRWAGRGEWPGTKLFSAAGGPHQLLRRFDVIIRCVLQRRPFWYLEYVAPLSRGSPTTCHRWHFTIQLAPELDVRSRHKTHSFSASASNIHLLVNMAEAQTRGKMLFSSFSILHVP